MLAIPFAIKRYKSLLGLWLVKILPFYGGKSTCLCAGRYQYYVKLQAKALRSCRYRFRFHESEPDKEPRAHNCPIDGKENLVDC